jgi:tetratricopeptide (TPR) repeat protein
MNFKRTGLILILTLIFIACKKDEKVNVEGDRVREYAGDLVNRSLFRQAIQEYEFYLDNYQVEPRERANVNYIIANTYFDRLNDYENALSYYLKIKHFYPESSLIDQVNKRIVACLERLERSEDAQQALDETVQLDPSDVEKKRPGAVVAKIGKREITQGDLDFEISQLPPTVREQFKDKEKKLEFLQEYVATELLYDTAKRAGLDKNTEIIEGAFQAKKTLMVRKLLEERVAGKIDIEDSDIELYYEANKDQYAEKDDEGNIIEEKPLSKVRKQVAEDLYMQKYKDAYRGLLERMILAEDVKFYKDRVQ